MALDSLALDHLLCLVHILSPAIIKDYLKPNLVLRLLDTGPQRSILELFFSSIDCVTDSLSLSHFASNTENPWIFEETRNWL